MNDGTGRLRAALEVFEGEDTPGTLGMALADLDGDARLDVVMSQGEHPTAVDECIFLGRGLPPDTAPPSIGPLRAVRKPGAIRIEARVHDRKGPTLAAEWQHVEIRWFAAGDSGPSRESGAATGQDAAAGQGNVPMRWYGEYLWRATIPPDATEAAVCAADAAGNETCRDVDLDVAR